MKNNSKGRKRNSELDKRIKTINELSKRAIRGELLNLATIEEIRKLIETPLDPNDIPLSGTRQRFLNLAVILESADIWWLADKVINEDEVIKRLSNLPEDKLTDIISIIENHQSKNGGLNKNQ